MNYEDTIYTNECQKGLWGQKIKKNFNWEIYLKNWRRVMVLNTTFNSITAISWWDVLLVEETRVP